jgi:hypothetical protein
MSNKKENNKIGSVLLEALYTPLENTPFQSIPAEGIMVTIQHKINIETNLRKLKGMENGVLAHIHPSQCVGQTRLK